jgi:uridine kinase
MDKGTRGELLNRLAGVIESATPRIHCGWPSTGLPPPARPRWPTSSRCSFAPGAGRLSAPRPKASTCPGNSATGAANSHLKPTTTTPSTTTRSAGSCSTRWARTATGGTSHAVYDLDTDTAVSAPTTTAPASAVLLLDGVFLLRPELIDRWDLSIFVSAAFEQILDRARIRDLSRLGSTAEVERRFRTRYIPAQKLYFATARPADHADIIVHNDEPRRPAWQVRPH